LIALACAPFVSKIAGAAAAAVPKTTVVTSPMPMVSGYMVYGCDRALTESDREVWITVNPRGEASPIYERFVQGEDGTWWKRIAEHRTYLAGENLSCGDAVRFE
jgi:hypothetical protein